VVCASTDELADSFGTWHSRSAVMAGNAVLTTAKAFLERLQGVASDYFGRPNVAPDWRNGRYWRSDTGANVGLAELARYAAGRGEQIDVPGIFTYSGAK